MINKKTYQSPSRYSVLAEIESKEDAVDELIVEQTIANANKLQEQSVRPSLPRAKKA